MLPSNGIKHHQNTQQHHHLFTMNINFYLLAVNVQIIEIVT